MTGPEHYKQAEKLIRMADRIADSGGDEGSILATAQVHATLAVAAATAGQTSVLAFHHDINDADVDAWGDAAGSHSAAAND